MGIPINSLCVECHFRKRLKLARSLGSDEKATQFSKLVMQEFLDAPEDLDSTQLGAMTDKLMQQFYGLGPDRLKEEKEFSNRFIMERLSQIQSRIEKTQDPVYAALQFAVLGNYLDFSALQGEVSFEALEKMLDSALEIDLDKEAYQAFCRDLSKGKRLLYLTDNAGEIVFDRVLAERLKQKYPHLEITFCVRGKPVSNDATREDAAAVGIPFPIIDNGTAIGGTAIGLVSYETKKALEEADVIIAKGMGNTESMYGCGYNVYYAFLVKCERFIQVFNKPKLTPMFIREKN